MLPALHGREGKLRQPTVVSLNTLRLLLHLQPRAALGAADSPAEVLGAVLGVVRQSAAAFKVRARVRVRVRARVRVRIRVREREQGLHRREEGGHPRGVAVHLVQQLLDGGTPGLG